MSNSVDLIPRTNRSYVPQKAHERRSQCKDDVSIEARQGLRTKNNPLIDSESQMSTCPCNPRWIVLPFFVQAQEYDLGKIIMIGHFATKRDDSESMAGNA